YFSAIRCKRRDRQTSTAIDKPITRNAEILGSISAEWKNSRLVASYTIQMQVANSNAVSMNAEKFSTLPCPYWWSASAGLSDTRTEKYVIAAATRSRPECAASDRIPRLPVVIPTTTFRLV